MNYSVCIDAVFMGKDFFDSMRTVKKCGYGAIEFWSWWDKDIEKIVKVKNEIGLDVATFCTKFADPGNVKLHQEYITGLKESIEVAKRLDCKTIIAQAGWTLPGICYEEHRENMMSLFKQAAPVVEAEGITLVIEPLNILVDHPGYHLSKSEDAFHVMDEIASPNIKILFDVYHQQITEGNLVTNIRKNISKIGHFHAAAVPGRATIVEGEINYKYVFNEIKETGYSGYMGLEYMAKQNPEAGLILTKRLL